MLARYDTTTRSHVELTPLRAEAWRVCDDRFEDGDIRRIVGYLQDVDGAFDMLWMRPHPGVVYTYPTIDAAVEAISVRLERTSYVH